MFVIDRVIRRGVHCIEELGAATPSQLTSRASNWEQRAEVVDDRVACITAPTAWDADLKSHSLNSFEVLKDSGIKRICSPSAWCIIQIEDQHPFFKSEKTLQVEVEN